MLAVRGAAAAMPQFSFLERIIRELEKDYIQLIEASYTETAQNYIAKDFYIKNGFTPAENNRFTRTLP